MHPERNEFATVGDDRTLRVWDATTCDLIKQTNLKWKGGLPFTLAFHAVRMTFLVLLVLSIFKILTSIPIFDIFTPRYPLFSIRNKTHTLTLDHLSSHVHTPLSHPQLAAWHTRPTAWRSQWVWDVATRACTRACFRYSTKTTSRWVRGGRGVM